MATYIYQGSTPTIRFKPLDNISVTDASLGEPSIVISQYDTFLSYDGENISVDGSSNTVSAKMSELDTLRLVDDTPALAQLIFSNETTGEVVRFPVVELTVLQTLADSVLDPVSPEPEPPAGEEVEEEDIYEEGELTPIEEVEDYELEDWYEFYDDTLEGDPEDLYPIDDVEPYVDADDGEE